jgi:hypothetical protein
MASIPEPVAEQPAQPPDAVNAAPPAHLLRVLEWRTGLEYPAARRAARRIADWPRGDGHPVLVIPGFLADRFSTQLLRNVLRRLGYRVYDWGFGLQRGVPQQHDGDAAGTPPASWATYGLLIDVGPTRRSRIRHPFSVRRSRSVMAE